MSSDDAVIERLDRLIALVAIAHGDALARVREQVQKDPVDAAIMSAAAEDWVLSGDLQRQVSKATGVAPRTVLRAITDLSGGHLLISRGSGKLTSYRASGVI
jgi:hypothetical protein